jgi:two-component system, OmpR family, KDP operon response regulator KdpE
MYQAGTHQAPESRSRRLQIEPRPDAVPTADEVESQLPAARPRILVVDDEPHDREIYGRILCYNGFDVVFADTGAAALSLLRQHPIALVILDLGLPDIHGLAVLQWIRGNSGYRQLPVIALSGFQYEQMAERARQAGSQRYIEKPASPVAVLHAVEDIVGRPPLAGLGDPPRIFDNTASNS